MSGGPDQAGGPMTLGFAGLGAMGAPMVRRLLGAGHRVLVHDVNPAAVATQGYRIWVLPNWARRRVRKVSSNAARMRFLFMDSLEPSSLARLRARRRSRAMFCGP